jgi:phosphoglycerol transferase MdoB-like AlkP superfamily enzyme
MESYRGDDVGVLGSKLDITPEFDHFSKEGILFKNFYANGFQTRHGLVASYCSLFPNYGSPVLKSYHKNNFYCLPQLLKDKGYSNLWAHGSDASFDNQLKFIPKVGFDSFFDIHDFPLTTEKLGWGVSDEALFNKWLVEIDKLKEPFFSSALTITNHHPFTVPERFRKFKSNEQRFRFYNAMYYSDYALGRFLREAKKQAWYENTLIFVTSDTSSHIAGHEKIRDIKQRVKLHSRVPLLILGGPVKKAGLVESFHSQVDIAPTIADILDLEEELPFVGQSLLDDNSNSLAFSNWPGNYWGVMSESASYFRSSNNKDHIFGDPKELAYLKTLSSSLIDISKWSYQNNKHSKIEKKN